MTDLNEELFLLDKEKYEHHYKPTFKRSDFSPKYVIDYLITLPFELAFPNNMIISFFEDNEFYCFNFNKIERKKYYSTSKENKGIPIEFFITSVEMSLFTSKVYYLTDDKCSKLFDQLLVYLNRIIISYLVKTKQEDVYQVSKEMLEPHTICKHLSIPDFNEITVSILLLHSDIVYKKESLSFEMQREIVEYSNIVKDNLNPFLLTEELMVNARRSFKKGFYKQTILNAQTSVETFIRTLYSEILKIEGASIDQIQDIQEGTSFIAIVKKELPKRIGGSWNIKSTKKEVGNWYNYCYKLRNRIAHGGYQPTFKETEIGMYASHDLRRFIVKRLNKTIKFASISQYL